jgi:uncharacterized protein (DUF736 family)
MNVGIFTRTEDGTLVGNLPTMGFREVSIEPVQQKGKGPDYAITVEGAELGAAWKKNATSSGRAYLSAKLVIPGRDPVFLAFFQNGDSTTYAAVYNEPERQTQPKNEA